MIFTSMKVSSYGGEYSFFTEDGTRYTLSAADAKRLGLSELSKDDLPVEFVDDETIVFLSSKLSAIKYCTYFLSFSDKSVSMLKRKMREKGYSEFVADEALKVLGNSGFTNDSELCIKKYSSIAKTKLYGPYRIKQELFAKGFNEEDIRNAQAECDIDFEEILEKLIQKLARTSKVDFSDRNSLQKFKAKLSRYGYGFETINAVMSSLCHDDTFYGED